MTDVREADLRDVLSSPAERGQVSAPQAQGLAGSVTTSRGSAMLPRLTRVSKVRWRPILMMLLYLSPTVLAGVYFGLIASGRYVSHAAFLVRTASKPSGGSGLTGLLSMAGLGRADDDTYSVENFLKSRDAVRLLQAKMPLVEMYGREGSDWLSRYPSLLYGTTNEELYRYYTHMTAVAFNATTGVTSLDVQAFRPDDALLISQSLLSMAETLVNDLNTRIHQDAVGAAETELKRQEMRLTDAQVAITTFQNKETMIDPVNNSIMVSQIVGKLQNDLAQQRARIADMTAGAPNNPSLPALLRQADITRSQIAQEEARVTSAKEGLADKLGQYQRLVLEREFATKALTLANSSLDNARTEARRKQLYIERVVEPELSDQPLLPLRTWTVFTVFLVNVFGLFLAWMLLSGVREHISSTR